jgi:hypothetical protein
MDVGRSGNGVLWTPAEVSAVPSKGGHLRPESPILNAESSAHLTTQ